MPVVTFIDELEDVAGIVADDLSSLVDSITDAMAPDGRPLGMVKQTQREQLRDYSLNLRGNPEAWRLWMQTRVADIEAKLAGQPPDVIASISPYDIAALYAWDFSRKMEARLKSETRKSGAEEAIE